MVDKSFKLTIVSLIIYEALILIINPQYGTVAKFFITLLYLFSFGCLTVYYFNNKKEITNAYKKYYLLFFVTIVWGIINILRSFEFNTQIINTLFGNPYTGFALVLPLAVILGYKLENIIWLNHITIKCLKIGLLISPIFILLPVFSKYITFFLQFFYIPLILFPYQKSRNKLFILIAALMLLYFEIKNGGRLISLQIIFYFLSLIFLFFYKKFKLKFLYGMVISVLVSVPLILVITDFNIFDVFAEQDVQFNDKTNTTDTRTFLYEELLADLKANDAIIYGKGATGHYYSDYFSQGVEGGDHENRINVEVGVLSMLLRGGIINVILNLAILIGAVYSSFTSSNNLSKYLVFIIVCHILSLFITDIPEYSVMSFTIWASIGCCLSSLVKIKSEDELKLSFIR